jgi:protein TonB
MTAPDGVADQPGRKPVLRLPAREKRDWRGSATSILLHGILIALFFAPGQSIFEIVDNEGAGGAGPAGGGGGGNRGTGGDRNAQERIVFQVPVQVPVPVVVPEVIPPVVEKKPEVVPPPVVQPPVEEKKADTSTAVAVETKAASTGSGGGAGDDGSAGAGPGRGGGVGSGEGPGRGSGVGPGTGGGTGTVYPPSVTTLVILPIPVPSKARPYSMTACFDVDSTAKATLIDFTPSKDANYNRKVRESLLGYKFRAAVRLDGTPVRDTVCVTAGVR